MKYKDKFEKIIIPQNVTNNPLEEELSLQDKLEVYSYIPSISEISAFSGHKLVIFDDNYKTALENESTLHMFVCGRHYNITIIFIQQNLFTNNKFSRDISLNYTHFILLKLKDLNQIEYLSRQIFGKSDSRKVLKIYKFIQSKYKFAHLLIDISQSSFTDIKLRSNIVLRNDAFEICYKLVE